MGHTKKKTIKKTENNKKRQVNKDDMIQLQFHLQRINNKNIIKLGH